MRAERPLLQPFAGGTDIMVDGRTRAGTVGYLDIQSLAELRGIRCTTGGVWIGAASTFAEIASDPLIRMHFPLLTASALLTGASAIQNRATIGGNIMNASPAADNPPVLLAYAARVTLVSTRGVRELAYGNFHLEYKRTACACDELLVSVFLPFLREGSYQYFRKVAGRRAQAISKVSVAAVIERHDGRWGDTRFGLASVGPVPVNGISLAACFVRGSTGVPDDEQLGRALAADISPRDDIRSTALYRFQVALNLVREASNHFTK